MPTARYWRMGFGASTSGTYISLTEVAFLDAALTDLSVGGTAFSSTFYTGGREPDKAFDKNLGTSWATSAYDFPAYIGYDHGAPVDVEYALFRGFSISEYPVSMNSVTVQWSDDGTTWSPPFRVRLIDGAFAVNQNTIVTLWDGSFGSVFVGADLFSWSPTPSGVSPTYLPGGAHSYRDFEFDGDGIIYGTVKEDGTPDVPVRRRVRLHREQDGMLVRETFSDATTGAYTFPWIARQRAYYVVAFDHTGTHGAVIRDNAIPEVMP